MDNDAPCKSVCIGFAQIKMHDGGVRTLIEVCHVPELKKILYLWVPWIQMVSLSQFSNYDMVSELVSL